MIFELSIGALIGTWSISILLWLLGIDNAGNWSVTIIITLLVVGAFLLNALH